VVPINVRCNLSIYTAKAFYKGGLEKEKIKFSNRGPNSVLMKENEKQNKKIADYLQ